MQNPEMASKVFFFFSKITFNISKETIVTRKGKMGLDAANLVN